MNLVQWRSHDSGTNWTRETITVQPDGLGHVPDGISAMQPGITLTYGRRPGRLLVPARVMPGGNGVAARPFHYSTAIYSDDGGANWQTSNPFPVRGTGEAALAELSNGNILYSSREHMTRGNRYLAWSYDCGNLWVGPYISPELPDGARGTSYGCMGGLLRLPVSGLDILLCSNCDTDAGQMPASVGGSTDVGREKVTVWASFDGGKTWPLKRLVDPGPSGYSNLGVGRAGTPSAGRIYLCYEGGSGGPASAVQVFAFNLSWLLNGRDIKSFF